jgi:hypothetical protein
MIIKPHNALLSALMFLMLAMTASGVDSTRESQNQAYRDYLETYRATRSATLVNAEQPKLSKVGPTYPL